MFANLGRSRAGLWASGFLFLVALVAVGCGESATPGPATSVEPVPRLPLSLGARDGIVGFDSEADLFETSPGDESTLEKEPGSPPAFLWTAHLDGETHRWSARALQGILAASDVRLRMELKSDAAGALWLQVEEEGGESYYTTVDPTTEWKLFDLALADWKLAEDKGLDGVLQSDKIRRLTLVDGAGVEGRSGPRRWWFREARFRYPESLPPASVAVHSKALIGLAGQPKNYRDTREAWGEVFARAKEMNAEVVQVIASNWPELEPATSQFAWAATDRWWDVRREQGHGFLIAQDFAGPFFHQDILKPADLEFRSFTDPEYLARYLALVSAYLERFAGGLGYFLIHAEGAYSYFEAHPGQLADYGRFLADVRAHIQKAHPAVRVGVNTDPHNSDKILTTFAASLDFVGYDLMKIDGHLETPDQVSGVVDRLVRLAGEKKVSLAVGWSTNRTEKTDEAEQADFFRQVARALNKHASKLEFVVGGVVFDDDPEVVGPVYRASFPDFPEDFVSAMTDSLANLGLVRRDGTTKPAWEVWKRSAEEYRRER